MTDSLFQDKDTHKVAQRWQLTFFERMTVQLLRFTKCWLGPWSSICAWQWIIWNCCSWHRIVQILHCSWCTLTSANSVFEQAFPSGCSRDAVLAHIFILLTAKRLFVPCFFLMFKFNSFLSMVSRPNDASHSYLFKACLCCIASRRKLQGVESNRGNQTQRRLHLH